MKNSNLPFLMNANNSMFVVINVQTRLAIAISDIGRLLQTNSALINQKSKHDVIVAGTEAHVCALQAITGLMGLGYNLIAAEDAVGSRRKSNKSTCILRMRQCGCHIVSSEMVLFEWLEQTDTKIFRKVLPVIRDLAQFDPFKKYLKKYDKTQAS